MKWGKLLFIGVAGATLYFILNRFAAGITYEFTGIKWLGRGAGLRLRLALLYRVGNNNNIAATVDSLKGRLLYGTYEVNEIKVEKPVTIQPGTSEQLQVIFEVKPGFLLSEIEKFFEKKGGFQKFRLKGIMSGKVGNVPFVLPLNENIGLAE